MNIKVRHDFRIRAIMFCVYVGVYGHRKTILLYCDIYIVYAQGSISEITGIILVIAISQELLEV